MRLIVTRRLSRSTAPPSFRPLFFNLFSFHTSAKRDLERKSPNSIALVSVQFLLVLSLSAIEDALTRLRTFDLVKFANRDYADFSSNNFDNTTSEINEKNTFMTSVN